MHSTHWTKLDTISRLPSAMNNGHTPHREESPPCVHISEKTSRTASPFSGVVTSQGTIGNSGFHVPSGSQPRERRRPRRPPSLFFCALPVVDYQSFWAWPYLTDRPQPSGPGRWSRNTVSFCSGSGTGLYSGATTFTSGGELVPVPEASTLLAVLGLIAPLAWRERRHWMRCREARGN